MTTKGEQKKQKEVEKKKLQETTQVLEEKVGAGKEVVVVVLDKMNTLFTSGMGLVAALAWNEAVKDIFDQIFSEQDRSSIWAKFGYAVVITIIVVMVTFRLTKFIEKIKKANGIENKKEKKKEAEA